MSERDALDHRDELQWRAVACARAGFMMQAAVWAMAADMCRAAWWAACHGTLEAERLVCALCRDE